MYVCVCVCVCLSVCTHTHAGKLSVCDAVEDENNMKMRNVVVFHTPTLTHSALTEQHSVNPIHDASNKYLLECVRAESVYHDTRTSSSVEEEDADDAKRIGKGGVCVCVERCVCGC